MTKSPFLDASGQISAWLTKQPRWFSYALHIAAREAFTQQDIDSLAAAACSESGFSLPFSRGDGSLLLLPVLAIIAGEVADSTASVENEQVIDHFVHEIAVVTDYDETASPVAEVLLENL